MKNNYILLTIFLLLSCGLLNAQTGTEIAFRQEDTAGNTGFKPHGTLWGYVFGDFAYKAKADTDGYSFGSPGRSGTQYSKLPENTKLFQMRRVYLGYNYDINPKFSAEILLAAEDDIYPQSGNLTTTGDVLGDSKFAPYLKLANIRWKEIFKGTDVAFGQVATPAFSMLSENIWGYRSIEKTAADLRKTPSFDQGITLQGHYTKGGVNFGYNLMAGNGSGAVPGLGMFPWYYGDIWAKFWNNRIIIDIYQDYQKLNWNYVVTGVTGHYHSDRNMTKIFVAYSVPKFTVGVEAFTNTLMGDIAASSNDSVFYKTTIATAVSVFGRGRLYKDKLGFFARYDSYDPSHNLSAVYDDKRIVNYAANSKAYDPTTKQTFFTAGLDFTPYPNVHIMPNIWMVQYTCSLPTQYYYLNLASGTEGTDLVYRLTVYYLFGKKEGIRF
jgi:hypothetical protein